MEIKENEYTQPSKEAFWLIIGSIVIFLIGLGLFNSKTLPLGLHYIIDEGIFKDIFIFVGKIFSVLVMLFGIGLFIGGGVTLVKPIKLKYSSEEKEFLESLLPEDGSSICTYENCNHKTVKNSIKCAKHHFEMVKEKPCPWNVSEEGSIIIEAKQDNTNE